MEIHLDGRRVEVRRGATLSEVLPDRDPRCSVAVIRPAPEKAERTPFIRIMTSRGEVIVETSDPRISFIEAPGIVGQLRVQWADRYVAAFGPFPTDIKPMRKTASYDRGDVILGCGGYDPSRSFLVFSKMRHAADHGAPEDGGVLGRVVSGRGIIDTWTPGDRIEGIERVVRWEDSTMSFTTTDGDLRLEDGMQLITHVAASAYGASEGKYDLSIAKSVEHFLLAVRDGLFAVDRSTSTCIRNCDLIQEEVEQELKRPRREGAIAIRSSGISVGCIYIYRADLPGSPVHTVVGQVTHGIELVKLAQEGETLSIRTTPEYLDLVGLTVREAKRIAESRGLRAVFDRGEEERLIVGQEPALTLHALASGQVMLETVSADRVLTLSLDDTRAPQTCRVFREMTGLRFRKIGRMPLFFRFEDVVLFKPELKSRLKVIPENVPEGEVPAFTIGITNQARKGVGTVGVRMTDNSEFGPTGEPFDGTNLFGRVLDPEKLRNFRERETVYLREERR